MSLKVYGAWRVALTEFEQATKDLQAEIQKQAFEWFVSLADPALEALEKKLGRPANFEELFDLEMRISSAFKKLSANGPSQLSIDCGFSFWIDVPAALVYIKAYGFCALNLKLPEWLKAKEYYYQNSSDKPDTYSEKEWQEREDNWYRVLKLPQYAYDVVDPRIAETMADITWKWVDSRFKARTGAT